MDPPDNRKLPKGRPCRDAHRTTIPDSTFPGTSLPVFIYYYYHNQLCPKLPIDHLDRDHVRGSRGADIVQDPLSVVRGRRDTGWPP